MNHSKFGFLQFSINTGPSAEVTWIFRVVRKCAMDTSATMPKCLGSEVSIHLWNHKTEADRLPQFLLKTDCNTKSGNRHTTNDNIIYDE